MRKLIAVAAAIAATMLATAPAQAVTNPSTGVFLSCSTAAYCQTHIDRLAYVGVKSLMLSTPSTCTEAYGIQNRAKLYGMNIYWVTRDQGWVGCTAQSIFTQTRGYYVVDEPYLNGISATTVGGYINNVNRWAPGKSTIMSHWTACQGDYTLTALNPYVTLGTSHGATCYPLTDRFITANEPTGIVYGPTRKTVDRAAQYGKGAFSVLKMFSWTDLPNNGGCLDCSHDQYPAASEFNIMRNCARKADTGGLWWWGYDLWKDDVTANPARYESRWSDFVNGALVGSYQDRPDCRTVNG